MSHQGASNITQSTSQIKEIAREKGIKNRIVPVILIHEGHKEDFVKKKQLKEQHYIASSILKTDKLWNEAYKYLDNKYDFHIHFWRWCSLD